MLSAYRIKTRNINAFNAEISATFNKIIHPAIRLQTHIYRCAWFIQTPCQGNEWDCGLHRKNEINTFHWWKLFIPVVEAEFLFISQGRPETPCCACWTAFVQPVFGA